MKNKLNQLINGVPRIEETLINYKNKISKRQAEYRKKNKDKISKQIAEYYKKNKDKISKQRAEYRKKNKDKIAEYQAEYYKKNKIIRMRERYDLLEGENWK